VNEPLSKPSQKTIAAIAAVAATPRVADTRSRVSCMSGAAGRFDARVAIGRR
jgi:hypothetical protein